MKQTIKILTYCLLLLFPFASQAQLTKVPVQKGYEIPYIFGEAFTVNYKTYFGCWTGELGKEGVRLCYIENDTIKLLPNPEFKPHSQNAFLGFYNYSELEANNFNSNGYAGKPVFFKYQVYMAFQEFGGRQFLTSFDGKDFSVFDTLKSGKEILQYEGHPIVFDNHLWLVMKHSPNCMKNDNTRLYKFDGEHFTEITLNDNLIPAECNNTFDELTGYSPPMEKVKFECTGSPVVYKGKLYYKFTDKEEKVSQLGRIDGNTVTLIPNPKGIDYYADTEFIDVWEDAKDFKSTSYIGEPIVFNEKLYLKYQHKYAHFILLAFDGKNFEEIPTPFKMPEPNYGYLGNPIVFNQKLYMQWNDPYSEENVLCYIDGKQKIKIIKNVGETFVSTGNKSGTYLFDNGGYMGNPVLFNNTLYLRMLYEYEVEDEYMKFKLYRLNGKKLELVEGQEKIRNKHNLLIPENEELKYFAPLHKTSNKLFLLYGYGMASEVWMLEE